MMPAFVLDRAGLWPGEVARHRRPVLSYTKDVMQSFVIRNPTSAPVRARHEITRVAASRAPLADTTAG